MRVGFLGIGEIAQAMIIGLAGHKGHEGLEGFEGFEHDICISARNAQRAERLKARYPEITIMKNEELAQSADVLFLCLMADQARALLPSLTFRAQTQVISVMVGLDQAELLQLCAPAKQVAIAIPLPSIAGSGSALPLYPDTPVLHQLYGARNKLLPCASEAELNAHFAASALASALLLQMREGADWLAGFTGDKRAAQVYIAALFSGFMQDVLDDPQNSFDCFLTALSTEGGLNASLLQAIQSAGLPETLIKGLDALKPRLGLDEQ